MMSGMTGERGKEGDEGNIGILEHLLFIRSKKGYC